MSETFTKNQTPLHTMTLTGQGRIVIIPDVAVIRLGVALTGDDLESLQSQNAQLSQAVLDTLHQMGVTDIKTFQYAIDKNYKYTDGIPVDMGFTVRNILEIRTNDTESIGALIDAAVGAGANVVDLVSLETSEPEYYYQQALNLAIWDAMAKAGSISAEFKIQVDPIPSKITENSTMPMPRLALPAQQEMAVTPVVPGEITIEANITAEFHY